MPPDYHYALHDAARDSTDDLGDMVLLNDIEATAFGGRVVRELLVSNPSNYALWDLRVTQLDRLVTSIPLH